MHPLLSISYNVLGETSRYNPKDRNPKNKKGDFKIEYTNIFKI